MMSEWHPT